MKRPGGQQRVGTKPHSTLLRGPCVFQGQTTLGLSIASEDMSTLKQRESLVPLAPGVYRNWWQKHGLRAH